MYKAILWDKGTIRFPGLYDGIPIDHYHERFDAGTGELRTLCDGPSISSSGLRTIFSKSPADYYWCSPYNPRAVQEPVKEHFVLGRALHHLALGEKMFSKSFVQRPDTLDGEAWQGNRKVCKAWIADKEMAGLTVLSPKQVGHIKGMLLTIGQHPLFKQGILAGLVEHSLIARDARTGIWLKSRPDAIPTHSGDFCDLKTATSIQTPDLRSAIHDYGYNQQAALTDLLAREVLKIELSSYALFFVQSEQPYSARVVQLKQVDIERGARQNRWAIDTFAKCLKAKNWPGPGGDRADAEFIELPEWAGKSIDDRLEYLNKSP